MTNAVATIGLTYRSTDIQEAFGNTSGMFMEIVRGLFDPPSVRGSDIVVPTKVGRIQGTRSKDMIIVELHGIVWGATGATAVSTYQTKRLAVLALFDPTISGTLVATLADSSTKTLTNARTRPGFAWREITDAYAEVSIELESTTGAWA